MIKTFRKGVKVRYIGNNPRYKEAFGDKVFTVRQKRGDWIVGYFPLKYSDRYRRWFYDEYAMRISDFEIIGG